MAATPLRNERGSGIGGRTSQGAPPGYTAPVEEPEGAISASGAESRGRHISKPITIDDGYRSGPSASLVRGLALGVAGLGALVLWGWWLDIAFLKSVFPGLVTMKANTALGFLLAGSGLCASAFPGRRGQTLGAIAGVALLLLGVVTLAQDLLGFDARIDQLLFAEDPDPQATGAPGRMSPASALGFLLVGASLCFRSPASVSQLCASMALLLGTFGLIGYLYSVEPLHRRTQLTGMAVHTALGLILAGVGVLLANPHTGIHRALFDPSNAGEQLRRLLPAAILVPIALGAMALVGSRFGLWDNDFETAVLATSTMVALVGLALVQYGSLRDSEAQRLETLASLAESEERYRRTFEHATIGIAHLAPDGRWLRANLRLCEMLGYDESELSELTYAAVSHLEDLELDARQWEMLRRGEISEYGVERRFRSKAGEEIVADVRLVREENRAGELLHVIAVMQDITGRKISEGTLRVYERALSGTQNGILITDASQEDNPILFTNPAFHEITGYQAHEVIGKNCRFLNERVRDQAAIGELRAAIEAGEECSVLLRNHRKDGTGFWNELSIAPVEDADGNTSHFVGIMTDATERVQATAEREELLKATESANQEKDRFLSVVSHELRSPLNAILAWSSILQDEVEGESATRATQAIEAAVRSQTRLVNDLLDVSRIHGEKLEVEKVEIELTNEIRSAVDLMQPIAMEKGVTLSVELPPREILLSADPERIAQVIRNLVDNALKFTPRGGRVEVVATDSGPQIGIDVRDSGVGLTPEALGRVFDEFWQGREPGGNAQGLGLGLPIVRYLVEQHGGTIEARSEGEGRGATFHLRLPKSSVSPEPENATRESAEPPRSFASAGSRQLDDVGSASDTESEGGADLAGLEIVVVDDDVPTVEALSILLEKEGAIVRRAYSVAEALRHFERGAPDLLVSDINLPDRNGMDLVAALREMDGPVRSILAVAVTGITDPQARGRIQRAGFDASLGKPVPPAFVVRELKRLRALDLRGAPATRRLLMIADDEDALAPVMERLEAEGHEIRSVTSAEAVEAFGKLEPHFVLLGTPLRGTRASTLAERLRASGDGVRVIAVLDADDRLEHEAFDYVCKKPLEASAIERILSFAEIES